MKIQFPTLFMLIVLGFILGGCLSEPKVPVEYDNGFSFDIPCDEHGVDTQVVSGSRLIRVYEISVDGEIQGEVTGEQITAILEIIKSIEEQNEKPSK